MKSNLRDDGRPERLRDGSGQVREPPAELTAALDRVRPRLGRLASSLLFFDTIGSTNDVAMSRTVAESPASSSDLSVPSPQRPVPSSPSREGLVVVADEQTAGRGRRGHTWFSPPGSGLYVSVVLAPAASPIDPDRATTLLTLAAGVALAEGIERATGLRIDLKWPNDLQVVRRKLGGILAESSGAGRPAETVVVGYGVNVLSAAFPQELRDRATSLESELGRVVDRHQLLAETLAALSQRYEDLLAGRFDAILDAWRGLAPGATGARVVWTTNAGITAGVTAGIDDAGALLVRTDDHVERIVSGEIIWL